MGQLPPQPMHYVGQAPAPPPQGPRFGRGLFSWVLFIGIAVLLFLLLSKEGTTHQTLPLGEFMTRLEAKQIRSISIEGDELTGTLANGQAGVPYRTALPPGLSGDWDFVQSLLQKAGTHTVV